MQTKISTLFYIKRTKANNLGHVPIYLRVTVDGDRFEMSSTKFIEPNRWSNDNSKVKGNSEEARLINSYLENLKIKIFVAEKVLLASDVPINLISLKNEILGIREKKRMLIPVQWRMFNKHLPHRRIIRNKIKSIIPTPKRKRLI